MSRRFIGPLHKFIWKPAHSKNFPINPVEWLPSKEVAHKPYKQLGRQRWEIYAQRAITIEPKETVTLALGLGVRMTRGWCPVSLGRGIQASGCILQGGGGGVFENTADIVVTILNDFDSVVVINEGDPLCLVAHTQRSRPVS